MSYATKEGVEVKVGQVWRDLDKRMDRYCRVVELGHTGTCQTIPAAIMKLCRHQGSVISDRTTKVRISRMYKHSTGWRLYKEAP